MGSELLILHGVGLWTGSTVPHLVYKDFVQRTRRIEDSMIMKGNCEITYTWPLCRRIHVAKRPNERVVRINECVEMKCD